MRTGTRALRLGLAGLALIWLARCSHSRPTPQQQFFGALGRGEGANASQIWLTMSAEDRLKLQRGEGLKPQTDPAEVQRRIRRHEQEQSAEPSETAVPAAPPASQRGTDDTAAP